MPIPEADLDGPRVVAASLVAARTVEVPVRPTLELHLSEPIDPATVHPGTIAFVPWEEVGRCNLTPECEEGSCERGSCQTDPLGTTALRRFDRGEGQEGEVLRIELEESLRGPDTAIRVTPRRPLRPHWRYTWIVGAAVADPQGAMLEDARGRVGPWRRDFVTAREGSSGPEARLHRPPVGARDVPTNLATIETAFALPVALDGRAFLLLEAEQGDVVTLEDPEPCPGWVAGLCLRWRVDGALVAGNRYRPADGTVEDRWGRAAIVPRSRGWFATGRGPDDVAPDKGSIRAHMVGPCLEVAYRGSDLVQLDVVLQEERAHALGMRPRVGVRVRESAESTEVVARIEVTDLATNRTSVEHPVVVPSVGHGVDPIAVVEILADAPGPEPVQEFVELVALGDRPGTVDDLWLTDLPWSEVVQALAAGDDPPGDALPPLRVQAGTVFVVVGPGYVVDGAPGAAKWVRLDSSLGESGLKNAGESVLLYGTAPLRLISSYGNHVPTGKGHEGRSVVRADSTACDVPQAWASHPAGHATPGSLP